MHGRGGAGVPRLCDALGVRVHAPRARAPETLLAGEPTDGAGRGGAVAAFSLARRPPALCVGKVPLIENMVAHRAAHVWTARCCVAAGASSSEGRDCDLCFRSPLHLFLWRSRVFFVGNVDHFLVPAVFIRGADRRVSRNAASTANGAMGGMDALTDERRHTRVPQRIVMRRARHSTLVDLDLRSAPAAFVPAHTFQGAPSLRSFDSGSVVAIEHSGFRACGELVTVVLRDALVRLGIGAFARCTKLEEITLSKHVRFVGGACFEACKSLTTANNRQTCETIPIFMYAGCVSLVNVELPPMTMEVSSGAFRECKLLRNVVLPASTVAVGDHAFSRSGLETVVFPARVAAVGQGVCSHCSSLTSVEFERSDGVRLTVGMHAFEECRALSTVELNVAKRGELRVRRYAFTGCSSIVALGLPPTASVGVGAFERCGALAAVEFSSCVAGRPINMDNFVFQRLLSLVRVSMPRVASIPDFAFRGCKSLRELVFEDGVISIGTHAFSQCHSLRTLSLPTVEHVGYRAFKDCTNLRTLALPCLKTLSDYAFAQSGIRDFVVSSTTKTIGARSFFGCARLAHVEFASAAGSDLVVGESAFDGCTSLVGVVLPRRTSAVHGCAFARCASLETFVCAWATRAAVDTTALVMCHALKLCVFGADCVFEAGRFVVLPVSRMFEGAGALRTLVVGARHKAEFEAWGGQGERLEFSDTCSAREFEFFTRRRWAWCTPRELRTVHVFALCCVAKRMCPQELVFVILSFCRRRTLAHVV